MNPVNFSERANAALVEEIYQRWLASPESVDASWRAFFQGFTLGADGRTLAGSSAAAPATPAAVYITLKFATRTQACQRSSCRHRTASTC